MRIGEPFKVLGGAAVRALPVHKWRRTQGVATFVRDLMALRKTLCLCTACERKMPRQWTRTYNYSYVQGFHAEGAACDYCRQVTTANMYCATDGAYHQQMEKGRQSVMETRRREAALFAKDRRYLMT